MRRRRRERLRRRRERKIKGKVTFRTLFLIAITLIFNTYAWFLYANTVTATLSAHVDSWHVTFEVEGEPVEHSFTFDVEHAYPGMLDVTKTLTVHNNGERNAEIRYEIRKVRIFDDIYLSQESVNEGETVPTGATIDSSANLLTMIQNTYPFEISFSDLTESVGPNESSNFNIGFSWDYESGQDESDTEYGINAYTYYENNNDSPAVEIVIKVIVTQDET